MMRKIAYIWACLLFAQLAQGEEVKPELKLTADTPFYGIGDEIAIEVVGIDKGDLEHYSVQAEKNFSGRRQDLVQDANVPTRYLLKVEEPGHYVIGLRDRRDKSGKGPVDMIGVLVDRDSILPVSAPPQDFNEFWRETWKEYRGDKDLQVTMTPVGTTPSGIESWDVEIALEGQTPVRGYLSIPKKDSENGLPVILSLHGAGVRSSALDRSQQLAAQGFIVMDINAHGIPNGMPKDYYDALSKNELANYNMRGAESRETWYFRNMFMRVLLALEYLKSRPDWNGKDLILWGSSQGGAQSIAGAALDPDVTIVAAGVPAMSGFECALQGYRSGWPQPLERTSNTPDPQTVAYYDMVNFARNLQADLIVSVGLIDRTCPPYGIYQMINAYPGEAYVYVDPKMSHAQPTKVNNAFMKEVKRRMKEKESSKEN